MTVLWEKSEVTDAAERNKLIAKTTITLQPAKAVDDAPAAEAAQLAELDSTIKSSVPSNFFATVPVGAGPDETALWRSMKPLDAMLLGEYWTKATPDKPVPNLTTGECQQWLGTGGKLYTGMVSTKTGKPHGLVRIVHPNGKIIEQTCCDG